MTSGALNAEPVAVASHAILLRGSSLKASRSSAARKASSTGGMGLARRLAKNLLEVRPSGVLASPRQPAAAARQARMALTRRPAALILGNLPSGVILDTATAVGHLKANLVRVTSAVRDGPRAVAMIAALRETALATRDVVVPTMGEPSTRGPPRPPSAVPLAEGRPSSSAIATAVHATARATDARGVRELSAVGVTPVRLSGRSVAASLPLARASSPSEGGAANDADEVLDMGVANGLERHTPRLVGLGHGHGGQRQAAKRDAFRPEAGPTGT